MNWKKVTTSSIQPQSRPVAPAPYRPQPIPKVLQTKQAANRPSIATAPSTVPPPHRSTMTNVTQPKASVQLRKIPVPPAAYRPNNGSTQAKLKAAQPARLFQPNALAPRKPGPFAPRTNAPIVQRHKRPSIGPRGPASRVLQLTQVINVRRTQTKLVDSAGGKSTGPQGWDSKFDLDVVDGRVVVTIRVRAAIDADLFGRNWAQKVTDQWSNRFAIKANEKLYPVVVNLVQVTTGQHYDIRVIRQGKTFDPKTRAHFGTAHMLEWGEHDPVNIPHEVGHMMGNLDEYGKIQGPEGDIRDYTTVPSTTIMGANSENNPLVKHYYLIEWAAKQELLALKLIGPTDTVETVPAVRLRHATAAAAATTTASVGPTQSEIIDRLGSILDKAPAKAPAKTASAKSAPTTEEPAFVKALKSLRKTDGPGSSAVATVSSGVTASPVTIHTSSGVSGSTKPPIPTKPPAHLGPPVKTAPPPEKGLKIGGAPPVTTTASTATEALAQQLHKARVELISEYLQANISSITPAQELWLSTHAWTTDRNWSAAAKKLLGLS